MNAEELSKIERQGYDFVRALIPHLDWVVTEWGDLAPRTRLWFVVLEWRSFDRHTPRKPPEEWRALLLPDEVFFAGAETAIREWVAGQ